MQTCHISVLIPLLALTITSQAATTVWNKLSAGTYDFNTAANWTGGLPGAGDTADMDEQLTGPVTINVSSDISVSRLFLGDDDATPEGYIRLTASPGAKVIIDQGSDTVAVIRGHYGLSTAPAWGGNIIEAPLELHSDLHVRPLGSVP